MEDEFKDVVWETLDEDARANLYYYVVDNCLTAEDFSCYPLEEDEIQPPQSSDDEGCPHMLSSQPTIGYGVQRRAGSAHARSTPRVLRHDDHDRDHGRGSRGVSG